MSPAPKNPNGSAPGAIRDPSPGSARSKQDPLIGRTVDGRFTILAVIARGGMGKVYKAEQAPLGRIFALKVLKPKYDGDDELEFQKRFFLEASTAAKLSHANTVTIFDYGRDGDIYYIAMELAKGRTLYRMLREDGPVDECRVAHIIREVGRSLREAHRLGVIHRDMKPANVMLLDRTEGELDAVKVLDFGLVKQFDTNDTEDLTQRGLFMGSPKYMAPEQILGNAVSPCTDIYSLGIVAFELLTGEVPFDRGASVKTLMAHVNDAPPPLHEVNPNIPPGSEMSRIVMRCLAKEPADRFDSIDALLRELTTVEGGGQLTDSLLSAPMVTAPPSTSDAYVRTETPVPQSVSGDVSSLGPMVGPPGLPAAELNIHPSETPHPMSQASIELDSPSRRTSPTMALVVAAVAVAAIVVGLVAVMPEGATTAASETVAPAASLSGLIPPPASAPTPTATELPVPSPVVRSVSVTSEPSGAKVREGGRVVCGATPCEVSWRDKAAEEQHELEFLKPGYLSQVVAVAVGDTEVNGVLKFAPRATGARAQPKVPMPTPQPKEGLSGYKDSPY